MSGDMLLGRRLGDYTIQTLLGQGGMARVYKGYDATLQRYAAVKVVEPNLLASQDEGEYRERFLREARAIARINHPCVVSVYQFGELDNLYYMAMGFVEGDDLREIIKEYNRQKKTMSDNQVLRIIRDIAEALDYSHKNGVIHRDVKPSNIMVTADGHAVLTDFGLALSAQEGTLGNTFGSVHYIAPEQAVSSAQAVPQSDLYSLGVVLYEMLTGRVPFEDASAMSVALKHISDPPPLPSLLNKRITPAVEAVLLKALDKDPRKRHLTGSAFSSALEAAFSASIVEDTDDLERDKTASNGDMSSRLRKPDAPKPTVTASKPPTASSRGGSSLLRPTKSIGVTEDSPTAKDVLNTALIADKDKRGTTSKKLAPIAVPKPERRRGRVIAMGMAFMVIIAIFALGAVILGNPPSTPIVDEDTTLPTRIALNNDANGGVVADTTRQVRTDGEPSATATEDKSSQLASTPTPRIEALNTDEPQLLLYYDGRMLVTYNRASDDTTTLNLTDLTFTRLSDGVQFESNEWLRVTTRSIRLSEMRKVDCFQIIDQPFTGLELPDFCRFNQGYIRTPRSFWLSDVVGDRFEVRHNDELLATCPTTITEIDTPTHCEVKLSTVGG
ncbi:MAG: serine/threonine-protein kinase [bacterium]|nr:serine/threonine-protein kinase [bacterium]